METSGSPSATDVHDSNNESFSLSGDEFDSIVGTIDVNEATNTYLLADKFGKPDLETFRRNQLMQFSTRKIVWSFNQQVTARVSAINFQPFIQEILPL